MKKKVLTIGGAMHDIFIEYEDPSVLHVHTTEQQSFIMLEEGKKIEVNTIQDFVGGGAANTAVSFKRLGFDVCAFFKIGMDWAGQIILDSLRKQEIDIDYVVKTSAEKTGTSFIIPSESGNRVALVYRGANLTIQADDIQHQLLSDADLIYITSLSKHSALALKPITDMAKKYKKKVAINPGGSQLKASLSTLCESLANIDIFILNAQEAEQFMGCLLQSDAAFAQNLTSSAVSDIHKDHMPSLLKTSIMFENYCFTFMHYFKEILSRGPKIVVVTNGEEGVYIATHMTIYFYPSLSINVVSTLGAGDAFGSCFVGMLLHGASIEDALIAGIYNSCSVISHLGTQTGLLTKEELEEKIKQADKGLLQKFELRI